MSQVDHTSRAHALLSASGASRWLNCTPSAKLEEKAQQSKTSVYAEEGTLAHEFGQIGIQHAVKRISDKVYNAEIKKLRKHVLYTTEMEPEVQKYIDYVLEVFNAVKAVCPDAILLIEERLDYSHLVEGGFGTGDVCIIADGTLYVIDLKYGKGVQVDATDNAQLKLYGCGALRKFEMLYDIHTIQLVIVQPRLNHASTFILSADDLNTWGEEFVKPRALLAYAGEGHQVAGSWCKFCKVKAMCKTLAAENTKLAQHDFADPNLLTDKELITIYGQLDMLVDWANSVKEFILAEALKGKQWEGYKVVEGRSNRKWVDEDKVMLTLFDALYDDTQILTKKLKGIGDIEKLVGKAEFPKLLGDLVIKPQGAPTLVPDADKRPALGSLEQAQNDFNKFN